MARTWSTLGKQLGNIAREQGPKFVRTRGPKLVEQLQKSGVLPKSLGLIGASAGPGLIPGRPVASTSFPTAQRARRVVYAPKLDGRADPGEIVWTWVTYEEDATQGKDRPVLVVGRDSTTLLGLMLSSNPERQSDPDWVEPVGFGWTECSMYPNRGSGARERSWNERCSTRSPPGCATSSAGADSACADSAVVVARPTEDSAVDECTQRAADQREHDERPDLRERAVLVRRDAETARRVH